MDGLFVQYRNIPEFPGYRIGDDGSVWSKWRSCRWGRILTNDNWRRLKPTIRKDRTSGRAYAYLNLTRDGNPFTYNVHRIVLETFIGPRPEGMECRHLNGVPTDNRLANLIWGTPEENHEDNHRLGAYRKGGRHQMAKLTEEQVLEIRKLYAQGGYFYRELAEKYGVTFTCVAAIINRRSWTHI